MSLADNACSLKWLCFGTGLIQLFFGVFRGNQCHHVIWRQILHKAVFLSQILQISTMVVLYMNTFIVKIDFFFDTLYLIPLRNNGKYI